MLIKCYAYKKHVLLKPLSKKSNNHRTRESSVTEKCNKYCKTNLQSNGSAYQQT